MGVIRSLMLLVTGALSGAGATAYVLRSVPPPAGQVGMQAGMQTGRRPQAELPGGTRVAADVNAAGGTAARAGTALDAGAAAEQWKQRAQVVQAQLQEVERAVADLRDELAAARRWQVRLPALAHFGEKLVNQPSFKAAAADAVIAAGRLPSFGSECQDLTLLTGIGVAYEQRLYAAGVGTFWEAAHVSDEEFVRFLHLTELQRPNFNGAAIRAHAAQLAASTGTVGLLWEGPTPDDFERIKGIGKVFEQRLYNAGIRTYAALAAASPEQIATLLPGMAVRPDIADWIAQAKALVVKE